MISGVCARSNGNSNISGKYIYSKSIKYFWFFLVEAEVDRAAGVRDSGGEEQNLVT